MSDNCPYEDEVIRLRAEVERLRYEVAGHLKAWDCEHAENERLRAALRPFAAHDWMDAELEDDNCKLARGSGPITVGHWRAARRALEEDS